MMFQSYKFKKNRRVFSVGFYNLENLFDTEDDPYTQDDEFLPNAEKRWTEFRYKRKVEKLGTVISNIGYPTSGKAPVIVGLAEVENKKVLKDLIRSKHLINKGYDFVHFDSSDERGMDTALIYQKSFFKVINSQAESIYLEDKYGKRDYTRDILWVTGVLNGEIVHVLVNHWSSRREGQEKSEPKRIAGAEKNLEIIQKIKAANSDAKIIVMGDFNDDPSDKSVNIIQNKGFYNPMLKLHTKINGSLSFRGNWNLFDQVLISHSFLQYKKNKHSFLTAKIFDANFIKVYKGRHSGNPFRTYTGRRYLGGYSDHFPVYVQFKINR